MKLALAIGVVAPLLAWIICAINDVRRCAGLKEKLFVSAGHTLLLALMVVGALWGLSTLAAFLVFRLFLRWMAAKRLAIRMSEVGTAFRA